MSQKSIHVCEGCDVTCENPYAVKGLSLNKCKTSEEKELKG